MDHASERGASRIKTLIGMLIVVAFLYFAAKVVPIYFANFQLQDKMRDEALYAQANRRTPQEIQQIIVTEAQGLDLPVSPDEVAVDMTPQGTRISAKYTVTVDLTFYQLTLKMNPSAGKE